MDRLGEAADWLSSRTQAYASVTITYARGAQSVTLTATPGSYVLKVSDPSGAMRVVRTDRDYLIPVASLILGGSVTLPAKGDTITETLRDGTTATYSVLPYSQDEPVYRYSDHENTILRVHTKRVS